ncbi:hypothetical protein PVAP13_5KG166100 [Panicum virgatum]|uniref:Uncharacterized protein n=1 Tax=Panicum virgatum TaxID=38727 RepID=A0A8T0SD46_PANVG|nr:hypothetical protein PVAP13_5KG166100 [Panicum virgatum]
MGVRTPAGGWAAGFPFAKQLGRRHTTVTGLAFEYSNCTPMVAQDFTSTCLLYIRGPSRSAWKDREGEGRELDQSSAHHMTRAAKRNGLPCVGSTPKKIRLD